MTSKKELKEKAYFNKVNTFRWRLDDEGKSETNSRLIQWSDGTFGIYVGENYFDIKGDDIDNEALYCVQDDHLMISQKNIDHSGKLHDPVDIIESKVKNVIPINYDDLEEEFEKKRKTS